MGGGEIYAKFARDGFTGVTGDQLPILAGHLENLAVETGLAAPAFEAQAVQAVHGIFCNHNEPGGVRLDFLQRLDPIAQNHFATVLGETNPSNAADLARRFRDEILHLVSAYSPLS